jgi:hypothetical protein
MASRKLSSERRAKSSRRAETTASGTGGSTVIHASDARARQVAVRTDRLIVEFVDGRMIAVPLDRFPRLIEASARERRNFEIIGDGTLIHWPDVDEDIDVANLLRP